MNTAPGFPICRQITRSRWMCFFALVGLSSIIGWKPTPPRSLLASATKVVSIKDWIGSAYGWRSNQTLMILDPDTVSSFPFQDHWEALFIAADTGTCSPFSVFDQEQQPLQTVPEWQFSPDGKWLLFTGGRQTDPRWIVLAMDGSRRLTWPRNKAETYFFAWQRDSQSWISFHRVQKKPVLTVYRLDRPGRSVDMPVPLRRNRYLLGTTSHGTVLAFTLSTPASNDNEAITIDEVSLSPKAALLHTYHGYAPSSDGVVQVLLSPQADRLAWITSDADPLESNNNRHVISVWVNRLDGSHAVQVGQQQFTTDGSTNIPVPSYFAWLPDGKRLSFLYQDTLYTLPIHE